jgi:hypothetical protein
MIKLQILQNQLDQTLKFKTLQEMEMFLVPYLENLQNNNFELSFNELKLNVLSNDYLWLQIIIQAFFSKLMFLNVDVKKITLIIILP